jgi:formiminoglutamase
MGAPLSKTSISHSAAFRLPDAIRGVFQAFTPYSEFHDLDLSRVLSVVDFGNAKTHITDLSACLHNIERAVQHYWSQFQSPLLLLGGDHSITGASVCGLVNATKKRLGILHFDAHHDVRNLEDGGRSNGTPFRTILESGSVEGKRIVQIGIRDFTNAKAYREYVIQHQVTVIPARQVAKNGLLKVVQQAVELVSQDADGLYISFDLDVLDQSFVPGVPAPGPGGLAVWDVIEALEYLGMQTNVIMLDLVCADPAQDFRDLTTRVAANLVLAFLTGVALRNA